MNQNPLSHDDPRLTAYAFNEMSAAERAEFEALLQSDPAARQVVEDIRSAGALLSGALESEPMVASTPVAASAAKRPSGAGKLLHFPHFYYVVSGLAAACFALFFVRWQANYEQQSQMTEWKGKHEVAARMAMPAPAPAPADSLAMPLMMSGSSGNEQVALDVAEAPVSQEVERRAVAESYKRAKEQESSARVAAAKSAAAARGQVDLKDIGSSITYGFGPGDRPTSPPPPPPVVDWSVPPKAAAETEANTEAYAYRRDNGFQRVADQPLSTFSIDVDTASYANVRRFLSAGQRPPADAVRIEELLNYFHYDYRGPEGDVPFAANIEVAAAPWAPAHRLVRIGLKGREVSDAARPAANLVFLIDVSGSMSAANKLPLVKESLRLLVEKLRDDDRVAIAVYAGNSGLVLPSTPVSRKEDILNAIDHLEAGGSTNGAMGIQLAYDIAKANLVPGGVNRVLLATDGDFNVGTTSEGELVRLIEEKAKSGVFLSVLGFGMGNYKDSTLESLADKGNGNYAYIDTLAEAKKVLVEQAGGTLVTIAKDVKIQVEFNPVQVQSYRLIGYENRLLAKEDFANDKVDAGEIGAGHTVTALYEVVPAGGAEAAGTAPAAEPLRYGAFTNQRSAGSAEESAESRKKVDGSLRGELLSVAVRYKEPAGDTSRKLLFPMRDDGRSFEQSSDDFKFAAAVAGFGMVLRDSPDKGATSLTDVANWARAGTGADHGSYRHEFLLVVQKARQLLR